MEPIVTDKIVTDKMKMPDETQRALGMPEEVLPWAVPAGQAGWQTIRNVSADRSTSPGSYLRPPSAMLRIGPHRTAGAR